MAGPGPLGTLSTVSDVQNKPGADAGAPAHEDLPGVRATIARGGPAKYHKAAEAAGKLFARDRIALLVDAGRLGAGKIFHSQVRASGSVPQVCALFGPSAAGGAYIPAFCDYVAMVDGNASMYLGSPRMVEMVVKEKTTLEEMGGARMHCTVSGCGHYLAGSERDALTAVRRYLSYLPSSWRQPPPPGPAAGPEDIDLAAMVPASERQAFDMRRYLRGLVDAESFFEIPQLWA